MRIPTLFYFIVLTSIFSCVKNVDFEQSEDLTFQPTLTASLVNFKQTAKEFYAGKAPDEVITIKDEFDSDIFSGDFTEENLERAELFFEIKNTIKRPFNTKIEFIDEAGKLRHVIDLKIDEIRAGKEVIVEHLEVFKNESLLDLKATKKIALTFSMLKGTGGDESGRLKMRSKVTFFLKINTTD